MVMGFMVGDGRGYEMVESGQALDKLLPQDEWILEDLTRSSREALLEEKKKGNVPYRVAIRNIPPPDAEVLIECIKVVGQDVTAMPVELRHLEVEIYSEPCFVGRAEQAELRAEKSREEQREEQR
eukprot:Skav233128  [mRNA]  locus=scaffold792:128476:130010:+ [translate_table: standard]